jgi:hypothetical protein
MTSSALTKQNIRPHLRVRMARAAIIREALPCEDRRYTLEHASYRHGPSIH